MGVIGPAAIAAAAVGLVVHHQVDIRGPFGLHREVIQVIQATDDQITAVTSVTSCHIMISVGAEWGAVIAKLCQTERFLDRPSKDKGLKIVRCLETPS